MDATKNISLIKILTETVSTIQANMTSVVNLECGQQVGLAVEMNGMLPLVNMDSIGVILKQNSSSIVSIMENKILTLNIQIAFVEDLSFTKSQPKRERRLTMSHALYIQVILKLGIKRQATDSGLAVKVRQERQLLAQKTDIKWPNGLMKKLRNITLTNL